MSIGPRINSSWSKLKRWPCGRWVFSRLIKRLVPYSGTIGGNVRELKPGFARVELPDRRRVRNHLGSIHAIALANVGELTSGLAVLTGLPDDWRGILVGLEVSYVKKARGLLTCTSKAELSTPRKNEVHSVSAVIVDQSKETVATVTAKWMLGPIKRKGNQA